ncbi:MAG: hypothetical protein MAG431_02098 [Chloroflexi bacterium]|nr:hypothetical protein [Chloroflexota bacterium]
MTLKNHLTRWKKETLDPLLNRFSERRTDFKTSSEIPLPRLALPQDGGEEYLEKLGFPGEYPPPESG